MELAQDREQLWDLVLTDLMKKWVRTMESGSNWLMIVFTNRLGY
jgi:hypothetical protein